MNVCGCDVAVPSFYFDVFFIIGRSELAHLRRSGNPQNQIEMIRNRNQRVSVTSGNILHLRF